MAFLQRLKYCSKKNKIKWDILGILVLCLWWSSPNSTCFLQGDVVSGLVLQVSSSVVLTALLHCFSCFGFFFHFVNFWVYCSPLSIREMGFFYSSYTTGEIQKMSSGFRSQICCNKNDTGSKVINEYWISNVDSVLEHFEHFCFGTNTLLGLKCERLAGFIFFFPERGLLLCGNTVSYAT